DPRERPATQLVKQLKAKELVPHFRQHEARAALFGPPERLVELLLLNEAGKRGFVFGKAFFVVTDAYVALLLAAAAKVFEYEPRGVRIGLGIDGPLRQQFFRRAPFFVCRRRLQ